MACSDLHAFCLIDLSHDGGMICAHSIIDMFYRRSFVKKEKSPKKKLDSHDNSTLPSVPVRRENENIERPRGRKTKQEMYPYCEPTPNG